MDLTRNLCAEFVDSLQYSILIILRFRALYATRIYTINAQAPSKLSNIQMCIYVYTYPDAGSLCIIPKSMGKSFQKDFSFVKMSSFLFLLICTIASHILVCAASALPLERTPVSEQSQPQFPSLNAQYPPICVKAAQNLDWAGTIDAQDCADAIGRLWDRVLPYGYTQWKFWASSVD